MPTWTVLLALFLVAWVRAESPETSKCHQSQETETRKKHIMIVSPAAHSHVILLREIGVGIKELYPQYRVSFATGSKFVKFANDAGLEGLLGARNSSDCAHFNPVNDAITKQILEEGPGSENVFDMLIPCLVHLYDCIHDQLEQLIINEKPDYLLIDLFALSATDLAHKYQIPYGFLSCLGVGGFEARVWMPNGLIGGNLMDMHSISKRWENIRVTFRMLKSIGSLMGLLNAPRIAHGHPPNYGFEKLMNERLVILPEMWGYLPALSIRPVARMVGFLVVPPDSNRSITNPRDSSVVFDWLDNINAKGDKPAYVIYIAFGTHICVSQEIFDQLLPTLLAADPNAHVLVGIRDEVQITSELIEKQVNGTLRFKRESWLPQAQMLNHPAVKLFVSHGGLSSLGESVHAEVPMIMIPFSADQPRNAYLIEDAGAGLVLNHKAMSVETITRTLRTIMGNYSAYQNAVARLHGLSELAGGRHAAARAVHEVVTYGVSHLRSTEDKFTVVERLNLDIVACLMMYFYVIYWILKKIFTKSGWVMHTFLATFFSIGFFLLYALLA